MHQKWSNIGNLCFKLIALIHIIGCLYVFLPCYTVIPLMIMSWSDDACLHCLRQHLAHSSCGGSSAPTHVTLCSRCFHLLKCPLTLPNHTRPTLHDAWLTSPSLKCSLFPHINLLPLPLSYQYCPPPNQIHLTHEQQKGWGADPLHTKNNPCITLTPPKLNY